MDLLFDDDWQGLLYEQLIYSLANLFYPLFQNVLVSLDFVLGDTVYNNHFFLKIFLSDFVRIFIHLFPSQFI